MSATSAIVLGSGPAAWSLVAALTQRGTAVTLIAPNPEIPWPQTYGMWTYQWDAQLAALTGEAVPFSMTWDSVVVTGDRDHNVGRSYCVLDNERVRSALQRTADASGRLTIKRSAAVAVSTSGDRCVVECADGNTVESSLVFDGTGAESTFVAREVQPTKSTSTASIRQTAFGLKVRAHRVPFAKDVCVLMDWRGPQRRDASFLYALPFRDGTWLFEETSLAYAGGRSQAELETRLRTRLDGLGVVLDEEIGREWVSFPMDVVMPRYGQPVIPIGAAAALVHPATGYSIAASFRTAVSLAANVADSRSQTVAEIRTKCWQTLWPADRRKARRLERYGLERLLTMDQSETRLFFDTFFQLNPAQTAVYLGGEAGAAELSRVMWTMFRKSPARLQRRLATGNPLMLARSLLG